MILTLIQSQQIVAKAEEYIGREYDYQTFNCLHFVRGIYRDIGIEIPLLSRAGFPLPEFNLSEEEFLKMPLGHTVFFKRKASTSSRVWTHVAIIISSTEVIHCSRHFGHKVVVTPVHEFLEIYALTPQGK